MAAYDGAAAMVWVGVRVRKEEGALRRRIGVLS